jgi:ferredoxin
MNGYHQDSDLLDMKNTIIYFTGTGNSLAVARLLGAGLPQVTIISINEMLRQSLFTLETDTCGFIFPVYCQNAPEIVRRLVRLIKLPTDSYIFSIATHNGDPGHSHFTLDRILRKNGQHLKAGFAILMPGNSITPYDSTNSDEETQRRLQAAPARVDIIADNILEKASLPYDGLDSLRKHQKGIRNMFRHRILYRVPKYFWATDKCNRCGLCVNICPENNIHLDSNSPKWGTHCQMCQACIHWCPQSAIQNGKDTMNRKRYHHPDISINDMLCRE